ncbi:dienelactone hydrolase family protein [Cellulomonas cellasea]|uniref:Putative dienelactone hydrolase n=1 Tax=Cellulomonas cellasea TaxID=43670 RepID=A0A7W4UEN6_9CELL|nr:dienelactone hydrolase family protein [Cellulomonas cellasea]MBB2922203.1 putative dienelactone hydrolase [Cellulomonas cellasea]
MDLTASTLLPVATAGTVLLLVASGWAPRAARRRCAVAATALVLLCAVTAVVAQGWRWQLVPVLVAAALAAGVTRRRLRDPDPIRSAVPPAQRRGRVLVAIAAVAGVGLALTGAVAAWAFPVLTLPAPSGPAAVGTVVVEWVDPEREEVATPEPGDPRAVVAQLWYPAAVSDGPRAVYLGRDEREAALVASGVAALYGLPPFVLDDAARGRSGAVSGAAPQAGTARWPVVLFSPGLGGLRTQNTAWAQDLASHGYVVVALDHPYDSAVVVRDDGSVVRSSTTASGDAAEDARRAAGWAGVRAADLRFALTVLGELDRGERAGAPMLAGRLDVQRAAVVGHSMGGAAALLAAADDDRFDAVVDVDGFPRGDGVGPRQPALALVAGRGLGDTDGDDAYAAALEDVLREAAPGYRLTVPGAAHLTFTDAPLYLPPVPSMMGDFGRERAHRLTTDATRAFLDAVLWGEGADGLADELAAFGRVETLGR